MKTADILQAIERLHRAGSALRCGDLTIPQQCSLATECYDSAVTLRHALEREHPETKLETT